MKKPGFMMLETIIAIGALTFIAMLAISIVTTNLNHVRMLKERLEILSSLQRHLIIKLLNPAQKESNELMFEREELTVKTKLAEIAPKSSLKNHIHEIKLLNVAGHQDNNKQPSMSLVGFVITPQQEEQ